MTVYIDENGERHAYLPRKWGDCICVTWDYLQSIGWRQETVEDAGDELDDELDELDEAGERRLIEFSIAYAIYALANRYDALQELQGIAGQGTLSLADAFALAKGKGVTDAEWSAFLAEVTPLKWQLEIATGGTFAEAWAGFASRLPSILETIAEAETEGEGDGA